jgi:hypothetical protein
MICYLRPLVEVNGTTSLTESGAGMPVGGACTFFCRFGRGDADLRARFRDTGPAYGSKTRRVTGCTSQIVGMRLFKLCGPGRWSVA